MSDDPVIEPRRDRLAAKAGGSLRALTAHGMAINAAFSIGLQGLNFARGVLVAMFLAPGDYGLWAIITVGYMTLLRLKQVGIVDKYIQQDDPDEEVAFQKAFTLEAILTGGFTLLLIAATPLLALIYGQPEIIAPGLIALLAMPAAILQTPIWTYAREMEFKRQRTLASFDPVVAMIVTVGLAAAGLGYWSFAIGNVAGAWAGAAIIVRNSKYPLRWRYDSGTARQYVRFSTPILVSQLGNIVLLQGTLLFANAAVGVAGIGALALANSVRNYTEFASGVISQTMYPGICAVKDRLDVLQESFVKSNRLAVMWGVPIGAGIALFAADIVTYVLGEQWRFAVPLFEAIGIVAAVGHIAFNWDVYLRALNNTRPLAVYAWVSLLGWAAGPIPLMFVDGVRGYGIGLSTVAIVTVAVRAYYLRRIFPGFRFIAHAARSLAPAILPIALLLAVRAAAPDDRTAVVVLAEMALYADATILSLWLVERRLLREAIGYMRRRASGAVELAT